MPDCSENYESEILNNKNANWVKCKYCSSKILNPQSAHFHNSEFELPLIAQKPAGQDGRDKPDVETVSLFWLVKDMYVFENVGFSNTVGNTKYLTCADCDVGPIGYHDLVTKRSYISLSRVSHS